MNKRNGEVVRLINVAGASESAISDAVGVEAQYVFVIDEEDLIGALPFKEPDFEGYLKERVQDFIGFGE